MPKKMKQRIFQKAARKIRERNLAKKISRIGRLGKEKDMKEGEKRFRLKQSRWREKVEARKKNEGKQVLESQRKERREKEYTQRTSSQPNLKGKNLGAGKSSKPIVQCRMASAGKENRSLRQEKAKKARLP